MKNSRGWMIWGALALCAAMVLGAMGWLTRSVLASEKERAEAEARADLEERTRLALWRMDAEGASVILAENRIPSRLYLSLVPSQPPVDLPVNDLAKLRFRALPNGPLSCPFEPAADPLGMEKLQNLRAILGTHPLPLEGGALLQCAALESEQSWQAIDKTGSAEKGENLALRQNQGLGKARSGQEYQTNFNDVERAQRAKVVGQTVNNANGFSQEDPVADSFPPVFGGQEPGEVGDMRAVWIANELFLLRQVSFATPTSAAEQVIQTVPVSHLVQGVWMDSTKVRDRLLGEIRDLLPTASLTPLTAVNGISPPSVEDPLALVSFPFRLERNESIQGEAILVGAPLVIGWIAVLCALAAVAVMVRGIMRLSERRASFVSAVTHELRTPLTTFQLYSDMLQSGAVKEEKRGEYFRTLHREAGRLSHLVENVLAFSGIEKGSARAAPATLPTGDLVQPMLERFAERLQEAGMTLSCDSADPAWQVVVKADRAAVEHVLFNLIDNAAKYATGSKEVEIAPEPGRDRFSILVRDHGPGIPSSERKRVFRAFHKSAAAAAESRPGVGLGLALSRRLARAGGGELELRDTREGTCFALDLPLARPE